MRERKLALRAPTVAGMLAERERPPVYLLQRQLLGVAADPDLPFAALGLPRPPPLPVPPVFAAELQVQECTHEPLEAQRVSSL